MNLLLLEQSDFATPEVARISGRRFKQLTEIIHAQPGKFCKAGVRGGMLGSAELLSLSGSEAEFRFIPEKNAPPPLPVTLVAALPRPQTFGKVIHCAVTMGVKRIIFIHTFKVEKSYWQSSKLAPEAIDSEVTLALEQCGDTMPPRIEFYRRFKPFAEDILPGITAGSLAIFGHPAAADDVPSKAAYSHPGGVTLIVGPEGGFTDYESMRLQDAGAKGVSLGPRVLRTEFAVAALLTKLSG